MHYNGFREVMQNGREGKALHAVCIRLANGSPGGLQNFPSDVAVPGIIDMHCNGLREVTHNNSEGKALHAVYIRLEGGSPEGVARAAGN